MPDTGISYGISPVDQAWTEVFNSVEDMRSGQFVNVSMPQCDIRIERRDAAYLALREIAQDAMQCVHGLKTLGLHSTRMQIIVFGAKTYLCMATRLPPCREDLECLAYHSI